MTPSPDDDFLVNMDLESCWVEPALAEALCEEGLCEYSLTQDVESGAIEDGLALCDGITPEDVWRFIGEEDPDATD